MDFTLRVLLVVVLGFATMLVKESIWGSNEEIAIQRLKSQCELNLPRNQECTMVFIAPKKLSNDKTTTEVGHSIPK